jgi:cytochrome c2
VIGNDATGEWSKDSLFGNLDRLVMVIRAMDPAWRDQVRTVPHDDASNTGLVFTDQPGQSLFKKICAPCHTIGVGDRVGPDLQGVTARRERAWLSSYIRNPHKMRAQNDPTALALAAKYKSARMPILGVTENDAADLIGYLQSETTRLSEAKKKCRRRCRGAGTSPPRPLAALALKGNGVRTVARAMTGRTLSVIRLRYAQVMRAQCCSRATQRAAMALLLVAALGVAITSARADVSVEGDIRAVRLHASHASVSEVLDALGATFDLRHRTSIPLDRTVHGHLLRGGLTR